MADNLLSNKVHYSTNDNVSVLYGTIRHIDKRVRNIVDGTWDTWPDDSLENYEISEDVPVGGLWAGSFSSTISVGFYIYQIRSAIGSYMSTVDELVGSVKGYWDGANLIPIDGVNVTQISGDSAAADNLEATYDGTGYFDPEAPAKQSQLSSLANVGAAINVVVSEDNTGGAIKGITFTGSQTGTYDNAEAADGVYHQIDNAGNDIDIVYGFTISSDGIPTQLNLAGYLNRNNDVLIVEGYDFSDTSWTQIGTIFGKAGSSNDELTFPMFLNMVGTSGSDLGKIYVRFRNTGESAQFSLKTDQLFISYSVVYRSVGYAEGAIWIDTNNGVAGTENYINGTADKPVLTLVDALIISNNLGIKRFHVRNNSLITLSGNSDYYTFLGSNWTLDLNGKSIAGAHFQGATVSGVSTGTGFDFHDCVLNNVSCHDGDLLNCALAGTITLLAAGTYYFNQCFSAVAGIATPAVEFGSVGDVNLNMRHYSGGIEIKNIGLVGTDKMSLEGHGQLVINANCVSGTIAIRGHFTITDNVPGGFVGGGGVISDDARYDVTQIDDVILANVDINAIQEQTDKFNNMITEDSAGNEFTVEALANAPTADVSALATEANVNSKHTDTDALINGLTDIDSAGVQAACESGIDSKITIVGGVIQRVALVDFISTNADAIDIADVTEGCEDAIDNRINTTAGKVDGVALVDVTTTNSDMKGTNNAATEAKQNIIDANVDAIKVETDKFNNMITEDSAGNEFTTEALANAPSGGDATEANQVLLLEDLEDVKGTGFVKDTDSLKSIKDAVDDLVPSSPVNIEHSSESIVRQGPSAETTSVHSFYISLNFRGTLSVNLWSRSQ